MRDMLKTKHDSYIRLYSLNTENECGRTRFTETVGTFRAYNNTEKLEKRLLQYKKKCERIEPKE